MSEEAKRELKVDIRRVLFRFSVPADLYQLFLVAITTDPRSKSDKSELNPEWILHNHAQDKQGNFLLKYHDKECVIEVLVRPTGQGGFRNFIQDLAHKHNIAFHDQT